ncbi:hypothetical protein DH2020_041908 [Rehmannia glutinosa]|uniref:Uncharacterized protein n=1 Tax=Rehmannia glutinosa TaxID=99300 RepID=A0ABR0UPZ4_REHGL
MGKARIDGHQRDVKTRCLRIEACYHARLKKIPLLKYYRSYFEKYIVCGAERKSQTNNTMGSRSGYEYGYSFRMDDDIISLYNREPLFLGMGTRQLKGFVFEIRTNFILKRRLDDGGADEIIDSEKLAATLPEDCDENWLKMNLTYRLKEYWMFDDEIDNLFREAIAFAKRMTADPKYASLLVIPVVVGLDVCTVQLVGEPADSARGRAIRTEGLIPMNMSWPMAPIPFGPTLPVSMREIAESTHG